MDGIKKRCLNKAWRKAQGTLQAFYRAWSDQDLHRGMEFAGGWIRESYSKRAGRGRLSFFEQYQERFIHLEWGAKTPLNSRY